MSILAQSLMKRLSLHQAWSRDHSLHLGDAARTINAPVWQGQRTQRRLVQTQKQKAPAVPRSQIAKPSKPLPIRSTPQAVSQPPRTSVGTQLPVVNTKAPIVATTPSAAANDGSRQTPTLRDYTPREVSNAELIASLSDKQVSKDIEDLLDANHNELLLYSAPHQSGLFTLSAVSGVCFLATCTSTTLGVLSAMPEGVLGTAAKIFAGTSGVLGVAFGVVLLTTTLKQIRSIRIIKQAPGQYRLRFDTGFRMYFWQPKSIEVGIDEAKLDRRLYTSMHNYYSIPKDARWRWLEATDRPFSLLRSLRQAFSGIGQKLANAFHAIKRDTGKAAIRKGIAQLQLKGTNWKLDLSEALFLEKGELLDKVLIEDTGVKESILSYVRKQFSL